MTTDRGESAESAASVRPSGQQPAAGTARPRAHCTVAGDGRIALRITTPVTPAPTASRPRLLLRLRPPKGRPEQVKHVFDLEPADGPGHWRTTIEPEPTLEEGRWDPYLLPAADDPATDPADTSRQRLLPGVRDLRALMTGRTPGATPSPLAVRVPYVTLDGYLALRTWLRTAHAEVDRVRVTDAALSVQGRLFGADLGAGAVALLRRRGKDGPVREAELTAQDAHRFSFTAAYQDLLDAPGTAGPGLWDVFVRPSADTPLVRTARLLDDVADRKKVFVYPSSTLDALEARPYYTVDNDLAVEITGG
ncbi:transferase [Streptomyces sp. NPDC059477]|uniref:transferase n=1 Tax=Streptomyces sp. NPDC059477 TaxID=3346847 RepID=UPI00369B7CF3